MQSRQEFPMQRKKRLVSSTRSFRAPLAILSEDVTSVVPEKIGSDANRAAPGIWNNELDRPRPSTRGISYVLNRMKNAVRFEHDTERNLLSAEPERRQFGISGRPQTVVISRECVKQHCRSSAHKRRDVNRAASHDRAKEMWLHLP